MERYWSKVTITAGCWEWRAYKVKTGHGRFRVGKEMKPAHRVAYELIVGPIPVGLDLDHLCRNPSCVNPAHLEPVTRAVNVMRGEGLCVVNAKKTHCLRGHKFTHENTYFDSMGKRSCKTCRAASLAKYREKCHSHISIQP